MKVKIKNFQSAKEVAFEIKGFTALVGKSNIGKSAIIRAIDGTFSNLEGDFFVTHGEKTAQVEIQCPEIHVIWRKGGGYNNYTINDEDLENVGRGSPHQITEAGFGPVDVGRTSLNVHIAGQFNPLFLLNESGSVAAEAICDVGRMAQLQEASRLCDTDIRNYKTELKIRKQDLTRVEETLEKYEGYDEVVGIVPHMDVIFEEIESLRREIEDLQAVQNKHEHLLHVVDTLQGVESVALPEWDGDHLIANVKEVSRLQKSLERPLITFKTLKGVDTVTVPPMPEYEDIGPLIRMVTRWERVRKFDGLNVDTLDLPDITVVENHYNEWAKLETLKSRVRKAASVIPAGKQELETLDKNLQEIDSQIQDMVQEMGVCPVCDQPTSTKAVQCPVEGMIDTGVLAFMDP
jgi:prefoldin subunit 5